jgi:malate dehydrogenase (oxaloacetate-decarboxylating)(NADP+)
MGARRENIFMLDRRGVIYAGREGVNAYKQEFANHTDKRSLTDAINGADVFIGLSGADLLSAEMLMSMADRPVVFACSNPDPEIKPELALATRDDLIIATGRSDYPNQVNNVLGFPFIFRGALDVRASRINEEMKVAAVMALSELAREPVPADVLAACELDELSFGMNYIIPKPVDGRLLARIAPAVARAAIDSGVARLPYPDNYQPTLDR